MSILFYLFVIVGLINLFHIAAFIIGGNIYDARAMINNKKYAKIPRRRRDPLISILIPAYNEELSISRCLDSIRKSTYKNFEVLVNNDASKDKTAKIVRNYMRKHPDFPLRLVNRRRNRGKAAGLNYIAKRYAKGELAMSLDADSVLDKKAMSNVVKYFDNPSVVGVAANVRIMEEFSMLGMLQRFEHMIAYRSKKLYTAINCELIIGGVASTYRRAILKRVHYYDDDTATEDIGLSMKIAGLGNKKNRLVYAADVVALTEGVHNFKGLLTQRFRWKLGSLQNLIKYRKLLFSLDRKYSIALSWYRMPMSYLGEILLLLEPIVLAYVVYLSFRLLSPTLFISAYVLITLYMLLIILPDEHLSLRQKIKMSALTLFVYFLFYIMNLVQLISALRCIHGAKNIVNLSSSGSTWTSPSRSGKIAPST